MTEADLSDRRPADTVDTVDTVDADAPERPKVSRRALLGAAAAGTAGLVVGRIAGPLVTAPPPDAPAPTASVAAAPATYPFFGPRQAGVTTPAQDHIHFAAFDMLERTDRGDLESLLRDWSSAAARLTAGLLVGPAGALGGDPDAAPKTRVRRWTWPRAA